MSRITKTIVLTMAVALVAHMPLCLKAQEKMTLTPRLQTLSVVAALEAKGDVNPVSQYFSGRSYLAQLDGCMNVTFEPGCRNFWHIHHGQVQVLVCVAGRGWYQEWGKEPVELTPGVVISVPEGVKHWHGAAKDSWMQHLTYHSDVREGASHEWLEPVSEEHYQHL